MPPMNVLLRADAGKTQGTGHVMRCMTLAEELLARGHRVTLMGDLGSVPWLEATVAASGVRHLHCQVNRLDTAWVANSSFDWVVVDSYAILPERVSQLQGTTRCLAIVDGDSRGIAADLYLDQNLGTGLGLVEALRGKVLAGSKFALIRDAVLEQRRPADVAEIGRRLRVVAFMGGTDPHGAIVGVAASIVTQRLDIELDLVTADTWRIATRDAVNGYPDVRLIKPTGNLPTILGRADIVVSGAGTSAWDICSMGRPAVLIALVENQRESLAAIDREGVALAIDATSGGADPLAGSGSMVASLVRNPDQRDELVKRCLQAFDGKGKVRVVEHMERIHRS